MTRRLALAALLAATAPVATFAQTPPAPETSKPAPFATVTPYGFIHVGYYDNLGPYTNKDYPG